MSAVETKSVVIHIGFPKTGTTSIQKFCNKNRNLLQDQGIIYPRLSIRSAKKNPINHTAFMEGLLTKPPKRLAADQVMAREAVSRVLDDFRSSSATTIFITHETISQRNDIDFELLRRWVGSDRLSIIVLVRTFDEWLESLYAQGVRSGLKIARPFTKTRLSHLEHVRFITGLRRFRQELPLARLTVLGFDQLKRTGLIAAVLRCAGVNDEPLLKAAGSFEAKNVSRPMSDVLFAAYASVALGDGHAAHRVTSILDQVRQDAALPPFPVCLMPFDLRSLARESYRADLPSIESEFGVKIDDPGPVTNADVDKRTFLTSTEYEFLADLVGPRLKRDEASKLRAGYQEALEAMS
jgi:hypothetical protein